MSRISGGSLSRIPPAVGVDVMDKDAFVGATCREDDISLCRSLELRRMVNNSSVAGRGIITSC